MAKFRKTLGTILKVFSAGILFAFYWFWINQKLITDTGQVFGLFSFFLLMCTATAYFPLPANLLVLGAVKSFDPVLVSLVAGLATLIAYLSEYFFFTFLFRFKKIANFKNSWLYKKIAPLFDRHRFFLLSFVSFLPIPSEPIRIYAITRQYPKSLFLTAGFVGRVPRYFLLGYFGRTYVNSIWFIIAVLLFPTFFLLLIRGSLSVVNMIRLRFETRQVESPVPFSVPFTNNPGNTPEADLEA
ncbi:MAG: VTT domain-containing protein [bacterium]